MAICFHIPRFAPERLAFAYSPLLEAVLSLHVLVEPKHHPAQHAFVRAARQLSPVLKREIAVFSFAYRGYVPEFFMPGPRGELAAVDDELHMLHTLPPATFAFELTRRFHRDIPPRDPDVLADHEARAALLAQEAPGVREAAEREDPACRDVIYLALSDPSACRDRFVQLLSAYWEALFRREWERIEPQLADAVAAAGSTIARDGFYGLLASLWPEIRADAQAEEVWLERADHNHDVTIGPADALTLVPSAFVWPHVRVNCDPPWPLGIIYPAPHVFQEAAPRIPPDALVRALRSVSDDTRLRALRLISLRPRATQELAPLLHISEAALSKHLRMLADAGVVEAKREGYYVLYSLRRDHMRAIFVSLGTYLGDANAALV